MAFKYCCFVSYRHVSENLGKKYTNLLVNALKGELELHLDPQPYIDMDRLNGAQFYNEALASAINESACMVVLYWPTYFSLEYTFCAREYKLMEDLEAERLKQIDDCCEKQNGLIIIIAFRGFNKIPRQIKQNRKCYNFEPYTVKRDIQNDRHFRNDLKEICEYVEQRCRVLNDIAQNLNNNRQLPNSEAIIPWIEQLCCATRAFPNREFFQ
jgi:hypothetical protein